MLFVCHPKILHKHCLQFLLGVKMDPRETENNAYAKVGGYKQRTLWYVTVFSGRGQLLLITTNPTERWSEGATEARIKPFVFVEIIS